MNVDRPTAAVVHEDDEAQRLHALVEPPRAELRRKLSGHVDALLELASALNTVQELERSLALMKDTLEDAKYNSEKADFLISVVRHELRTPLAGIFGLLDLLQETDLNPDQRGYCAHAYGALLTMSQQLDDNLDFSKLEAGKMTITNASFDVHAFLGDLADFVRPLAHKKNLSFALEIPPDFPSHIILDKLRLRQILLNLITNAIKYTDSGSVTVRARCTPDVSNGTFSLMFTVIDTGLGLTPQHQRDLFQPFHQVKSQLSTTGLGLAIASRMAALFGGELLLDSSVPNVGSSFSVVLPHVELGVPSLAPATPWGTKKSTILLAEDDPTIGFVMKKTLSRQGHTVDLVENGYLAVKAVREAPVGHYRIVFLDLQMPILGGIEALRQIKALPGTENLPVVAVSADILATEELQQHGFSAVLVKPCAQAMLEKIVTNL
jgi:signal transduction histidine kinase/CheY-like chemotaxis protein